jgi:hypothetical protein
MREHAFVSWRPADSWSYSYLLGLYLGDGCVVLHARTARLVITLDGIYPEIIEDAVASMQLAGPRLRVSVLSVKGSRALVVQSYSKHWLDVFPQHGPGRKHDRRIALADWQRDIVDRYPQQFLRGLIHSDGCRVYNVFTTRLPSGRVAVYRYPRYFFSNLSADIRQLFCEYCERLGVRWTQSNHRNISVSHRHSVAILDQFIGPKR